MRQVLEGLLDWRWRWKWKRRQRERKRRWAGLRRRIAGARKHGRWLHATRSLCCHADRADGHRRAGQPLPTRSSSRRSFRGKHHGEVASRSRRARHDRRDRPLHAGGNIAGTGNITATYGGATATTTDHGEYPDDGPRRSRYVANPPRRGPGGYGGVGGNGPGRAPVRRPDWRRLNGTPTADSSVTFLYPVRRHGLAASAPRAAPSVVPRARTRSTPSYVHIKEKNFEYKGYFASNATPPSSTCPIPQAAWTHDGVSRTAASRSRCRSSSAQGATAYGPYTETWTVAQATLQGTIYYNSYGTALVQNSDSGLDYYGNQYGAGTLAIAPGRHGAHARRGRVNEHQCGAVDGTGCRVCHTVAANGTALVTQAANSTPIDYCETVLPQSHERHDGGRRNAAGDA